MVARPSTKSTAAPSSGIGIGRQRIGVGLTTGNDAVSRCGGAGGLAAGRGVYPSWQTDGAMR